MKAQTKRWMVYLPDFKVRYDVGPENAVYVEVQKGDPKEYDSSWCEIAFKPKRCLKKKPRSGGKK